MGGRGALSTKLSEQLQKKHEKYAQQSMMFQRKIETDLTDFKYRKTKRLSKGYLEQLTQKQEKAYIRSQSQLERGKLINATTQRVETIRDSAKKNFQYFDDQLKNFGAYHGSVLEGRNHAKYQHCRNRYYYYRSRYEASISELKARQLRKNIRRGKKT